MQKNDFLIIFILFLFLPQALEASVAVEVDTGTETVNAVEGILTLPEGVSIGDIYTGNSAILIWVKKPTYLEKENTISFSGFTPGGFRGRYPLFSLSDVALENLKSALFTNTHGYLNDGSGTEANIKLRLVPTEILEDLIPPEDFPLTIASSPDIFEGRRFLSFATQDKGTGVSHYEYAATWLLAPSEEEWQVTESPRVLTSVENFKSIYIRATDEAGNTLVVSTAGAYRHALILIGTIIIVCLMFLRRSFYSPSSLPVSFPAES